MTNDLWVICRTEKKCKRCHTTIKVDEKTWRYGSAYSPCFMCQSCKVKDDIIIQNQRRMTVSESKSKEMILYGLTEKEYELWQINRYQSNIMNKWGCLEKAIIQHQNPNSPYYQKRTDRIKELIPTLFQSGVPMKVIMKKMKDYYEKSKRIHPKTNTPSR